MTVFDTEVVLVHGAFADASFWRKVIPRLMDDGIGVSAVQLPLSDFRADVSALRRHLDGRPRRVLLVGHSYGGCVITEVAASNEQVVGLVYVAAAAPLAYVPFRVWMQDNPGAYVAAAEPDSNGLLWMSETDFVQGLAHDLPEREARLLWAVQKPVPVAASSDHVEAEGWREKRCWYLVTVDDRVIPAGSQHDLAQRMSAETRTTSSGHMVALSQPEAVADVVRDAVLACSSSEEGGSGARWAPT